MSGYAQTSLSQLPHNAISYCAPRFILSQYPHIISVFLLIFHFPSSSLPVIISLHLPFLYFYLYIHLSNSHSLLAVAS